MDNPAEFSKHNKNTLRDAEELLTKYKEFFKWFEEPEDILEVGCANGNITGEVIYPFAKEHFEQLIGSDISQPAIEVANELHVKPNLSFVQMDIAEDQLWKKYENKFGHIISFYTLHLVGNPERWSENIFKMLKQNGQIFVVMVLPPHPFPLSIKDQRAEKSTPWAKYMEECPDLFVDFGENPLETIKGIIKNAGFDINVADVNVLKSAYQSFDALAATGLAVNNIQKHIPEDVRAEYIQDYLVKLKGNVQYEDGVYYYMKNVLVLVATKP